MKLLAAVAVALIYAQAAISMAQSAEEECGSLGVMKVDMDTLPADVNPDEIRKCRNHPEGFGHSPRGTRLFERACWTGESYGCSRGGDCWMTCGPSIEKYWCWNASNGGFGDWIRCNSWHDCNLWMDCAYNNCDECGCDC